MILPNYFLADLPPEATLSAGMIQEACQTLKRNREHYLQHRPTQSLIEALSEAACNWRCSDYALRQMALEHGPAQTGFSRETLTRGLEAFFSRLTPENFEALLVQELSHADRLDDLVATLEERQARRAALANGPEFLVHFTAGNLPNPTLMAMILGLLTRSAQFVKCASGTALLPRLFAHSLREVEPKLGACLEVAEWRGGSSALESALLAEADCVTATGTDETLTAIRQRLPGKTRFLGYGHRVSFGYVTAKAISGPGITQVVANASADVTAWNQLGCLSPHVFYVENGGRCSAEGFAEQLAIELARREQSEPRGTVPLETAAAIAARRTFYEVRAAHLPQSTRHWFSPGSTAWTVIYEADPRFQISCLHRFIYVKGVTDLTEALRGADDWRGRISTVGLAATADQAKPLAMQLARWGATRVCPVGQMQEPPLSWRHDGRLALADLVTWADWEQGGY